MWSYNAASEIGGAVSVWDSSDVSWSGNTTWSNNTGLVGGAVSVHDSSKVSWGGKTTWSHNTADSYGGAVRVYESSDVSWSRETTWSYNTAGVNGGGIYSFSSTVFMFNSSLFEGNTADAGGAVTLSGVDIGPEFVETNFTANFAEGWRCLLGHQWDSTCQRWRPSFFR